MQAHPTMHLDLVPPTRLLILLTFVLGMVCIFCLNTIDLLVVHPENEYMYVVRTL